MNRKPINSAIRASLTLGLFFLAVSSSCRAQSAPSSRDSFSIAEDGATSAGSLDSGPDALPPATAISLFSPAPATSASSDDGWHLSLSPYLWFPGVHGTIGALNRTASVHVSATDLLSHFRFGLMGFIEPRYNRFVFPVDLVWVRLGANNALPGPLNAITANVTANMFIFAPKVGYRIISQEKIKVDALAGIRYWHFGETLSFTPSLLGLNFSSSQNWVDPIVGGKIEVAVTPKISVTAAGDVGGWGAGSQLEYQIVGALGYHIAPTWTLSAGYRYLAVDYRNGGSVADLVMPGIFMGVTKVLK